ncbi:hypothetical protein TNCV_1329661 [Trichonephila clavipes]|nr:hypothetical protein TNCV_1329661 [Trichonephila clavipes]
MRFKSVEAQTLRVFVQLTYRPHHIQGLKFRGHNSLAVKVKDSCPACPEFRPGTVEDPPCRTGRCTLNMSRLERPPVGLVWNQGEGVSCSSLDHRSKLRGPSPKALKGKNDCDAERDRRERRDSSFTGEKPRFSVNGEANRLSDN